MPLIYVNSPQGTFTDSARDLLADELTDIALACEKLPNTPFVKSTTWIYFRDHDRSHVYHGGKSTGTKVISLEVNAFQGGFDVQAKKELFAQFTDAIRRHAGLPENDLVPVYIVMRDVPPADWGVFGDTITLDALRNPPLDAKPV